MIPPAGFAIAAITVMLWLVWSDTVRPRPSGKLVCGVRAAIFLGASAVFVVQMIQHPHLYRGGARALTILAAGVGVFGAAYFARRIVHRT